VFSEAELPMVAGGDQMYTPILGCVTSSAGGDHGVRLADMISLRVQATIEPGGGGVLL